VIVLSGSRPTSRPVIGLDAGADDYVVKPFSPRDSWLGCVGVRAQRRRAVQLRPDFGDLRIASMPGGSLSGRRLTLRRREFDLLVFLCSSPRQVFSRSSCW